jgi:hypothetical protein
MTDKPGLLSFELLDDAWNYAIRQFVHTKQWHKEDVKSYFTMLCINNTTHENCILCCCNYLLVEAMRDKPNQYADKMVAYVKHQRTVHPLLYQVPPPVRLEYWIHLPTRETIMHLSMNTQKAVLRLVLHWAADSDCGPVFKRSLTSLIESVQDLRLPFLPCRMFTTDKFGEFVAENYRALTMLSPWLFRCLQKPEFEPKVTVLPPATKPYSKWTVQENLGWLKVRRIEVPPKVPARVL